MKANDEKLLLYTFVFEFRGGTYLSQWEAANPIDAKRRWAMQLQTSGIAGMEKFEGQEFVEEVETENLTPITGLTDVWCFTVLFADQFGIVHVIKTS